MLLGLLLGLGVAALALETIPQGRDALGVRLVRMEVHGDRVVFDGIPIDTVTDTFVINTSGIPVDSGVQPEGEITLVRRLGWRGLEARQDSLFRIDSGRVGTARHLMLLVAPDTGLPLAQLADFLRSPAKEPDTFLLELPGGKRVRVRDRREYPDSLPQPLRVVLWDSAFFVMDGARGRRSMESPWLEGPKGLDSLRVVLERLRSKGRRMEAQLVLASENQLSFARLAGIAAELDRATGDGFELDDEGNSAWKLSRERDIVSAMERLMANDWETFGFPKGFVVDSEPLPDSSIRLEGLERIYFDAVDPMEVVTSAVRTSHGTLQEIVEGLAYLKNFPVHDSGRFDSIRTDYTCEGNCTWYTRDLKFPFVVPGHRLWLRERRLNPNEAKTYPTWWALYDNGRRTGFWVTGSPEDGRILTNYFMDSIVRGKDGRVFLRVHGEMYRSSLHCEKGVELAFSLVGHNLRLGTVRTAFNFLEDEIRAETCTADLCTRRDMEKASRTRLKACKYQEPFTEEWHFDWEKLNKVATCVTRSPKAEVTTRKVTEPSFIEVGWKPDTTAH